MSSILDEIKNHGSFKHLWIDSVGIHRSLGIDLKARAFLELTKSTPEELYDLLMKSLMWMETISEVLSTAKKLRQDKELEVDTSLNQALRNAGGGGKVTENKAVAKSHPEYIAAVKLYNTIYAYADYLERLLVNLDRYHYAIKSRIDASRNIERKYQ